MVHCSIAEPIETNPAKAANVQGSNASFAHLTSKAAFPSDPRTDATPRDSQGIHPQGVHAPARDLRFAHLTTSDGLSQSNVKAILQDHRGFMWFATQDGLDRYDGNSFVVYKHNPHDLDSLSANHVTDLIEDDQGYLWILHLHRRGEQIRSQNRTLYTLPPRPQQPQQHRRRFREQYRPRQSRLSVVWHGSKWPRQV